jgi:UDPglucose--hexose-1-phosphate uridylyltransferase
VRVIPNKFAALVREVPPARTIHRTRRTIQGFGVHDVIVETPDHSQSMAPLSDSHMADVLRIYKTRYDELSLIRASRISRCSRIAEWTRERAWNILIPS